MLKERARRLPHGEIRRVLLSSTHYEALGIEGDASSAKAKKAFPTLFMKLYVYQLCRSLAYIHSLGVCHRDINPQNLLVHPETHMLKLCDFGSAKILVKGEPNV